MNARKLLSAAKAVEAAYIEDVFSTYLYTGNGSTQTITNGIDLAGKGGLTWIKSRNDTYDHYLYDTLRGATKSLQSDTTTAEQTYSDSLTAFNSNGFALGANVRVNANTTTYASWTFRKQAKFFDVVTFTTDSGGQASNISHSLGSVPGCIFIKRTSGSQDWKVYHRSLTVPTGRYLELNGASAELNPSETWISVTSTTIGFPGTRLDGSSNYVAYLFAHDAGGFGASGSDNVITCGSFTTDGSGNATVTLGYEPQFVLIKSSTVAGSNWNLLDVMRGWSHATDDNGLYANSSAAEQNDDLGYPTATGFYAAMGSNNQTFIYIAIRRGPMKTPTTGTSVYTGVTRSGTGTSATISAGFVVDWWHCFNRGAGSPQSVSDRLRGSIKRFETNSTAAEDSTGTDVIFSSSQLGIVTSTLTGVNYNASGNTYIDHLFARAPGFFDEVCYTGTGVARTVAHNLGVVPELLIIKRRNTTGGWVTYDAFNGANKLTYLNTTAAATVTSNVINAVAATTFTVGSDSEVNASSSTYVAYLFATVAGVSKVGSYTGTGNTLQIDCGFTGGARFVLIKRTDSTGDWYVWDSARGIVAGNDPYLLLNSTAAEVTSTDYVDTYSAGFEISSTAPAAINANGGSFIFLAIA